MNKTAIEWTDFTWNPVTGCRHGCEYCYARRLAQRFTPQNPAIDHDCTQPGNGLHEIRYGRGNAWRYGFAPTLHSHRLTEPVERRKPAKIFVCSMADLFGAWVPQEWIQDVLTFVRRAPQHTFQFLTKNPSRYLGINFPAHAWAGMTVAQLKGVKVIDMAAISAGKRFVSFEPLLSEPEDGLELRGVDWAIIGGLTGPGAKPTPYAWGLKVLAACRRAGVPVFVKDNLGWPLKLREWPTVPA